MLAHARCSAIPGLPDVNLSTLHGKRVNNILFTVALGEIRYAVADGTEIGLSSAGEGRKRRETGSNCGDQSCGEGRGKELEDIVKETMRVGEGNKRFERTS